MTKAEDPRTGSSTASKHSLEFSAGVREHNIRCMQEQLFDVIVIGGGITGAGIARDAALRSLSVCLVDKEDFASGTSSKSARMIHGGLRYLEQYQIGLVVSACAERYRLRQMAPRLVQPAQFVLPIFKNAKIGMLQMRLGLWFYELLALFRNIKHHRTASPKQAAAREPVFAEAELEGAIYYYDCLADDSRLTLAAVKSSYSEGARVANYVEATSFLKNDNRLIGIEAVDRITKRAFQIRSRTVVNATGVWADEIRRMDDPNAKNNIVKNRGSHVVVSREKLPINDVIIFADAQSRTMYAVPWDRTVIVGTTDIDYVGDSESVYASAQEVHHILDAVRINFPAVNLKPNDIISTFAGLRPLIDLKGEKAYRASRDHMIFESDSGLLTIVGGKLTTHRKMAQDLVNRVVKKLSSEHQIRISPVRKTAGVPLFASENGSRINSKLMQDQYPWAEVATVNHLVKAYGNDAATILSAADAKLDLGRRIVPELPYIVAEIRYAVEHEMAMTLSDFLIRRTHIIHEAPDQGLGIAREVAEVMAKYLSWDASRINKEVAQYQEQVELSLRHSKE